MNTSMVFMDQNIRDPKPEHCMTGSGRITSGILSQRLSSTELMLTDLWPEPSAEENPPCLGTLNPEIRQILKQLETPFFFFDLDRIKKRVDSLRRWLNIQGIYYAVKCNSLSPVLATLAATGCGFEVNRAVEMDKLLALGVHPDRMINSSPITPSQDIVTMYDRGIRHFCVDSLAQVDNLACNAPGARIYVRLFHENQGCRFSLNRLGADMGKAAACLEAAQRRGLTTWGATFHVGSQCTTPGSWEAGIKACAELFSRFRGLTTINLGGGIPSACADGSMTLPMISREIKAAVETFFPGKRPALIVEPGRYLVSDSGMACASVTQVEERRLVSRAVVDLSVFSGLMELVEKTDGFQYPMETDSEGPLKRYSIGGASCAGTDILSRDIVLPQLSVDYRAPRKNTRIFIFNTGAYTLDYIGMNQASGFNGSRIPQSVFARRCKEVTNA